MFYLMTQHILFTITVSDDSDSERGNRLPPLHWLLFPISSKDSFIRTIPQHDFTQHGRCIINCGPLAGMRNSIMVPP